MQNNSPSKSSNSNDNFVEEFIDVNKHDVSSNFHFFKDDCLLQMSFTHQIIFHIKGKEIIQIQKIHQKN